MSSLTKQVGRFTEAEIDDEIVVMRLDTGEFYSLAGTAAAIWRLIDGTRDRAALVSSLAAEFDRGETDISDDVDEFINQLAELGLIAAS
jgi:hypothetical protein